MAWVPGRRLEVGAACRAVAGTERHSRRIGCVVVAAVGAGAHGLGPIPQFHRVPDHRRPGVDAERLAAGVAVAEKPAVRRERRQRRRLSALKGHVEGRLTRDTPMQRQRAMDAGAARRDRLDPWTRTWLSGGPATSSRLLASTALFHAAPRSARVSGFARPTVARVVQSSGSKPGAGAARHGAQRVREAGVLHREQHPLYARDPAGGAPVRRGRRLPSTGRRARGRGGRNGRSRAWALFHRVCPILRACRRICRRVGTARPCADTNRRGRGAWGQEVPVVAGRRAACAVGARRVPWRAGCRPRGPASPPTRRLRRQLVRFGAEQGLSTPLYDLAIDRKGLCLARHRRQAAGSLRRHRLPLLASRGSVAIRTPPSATRSPSSTSTRATDCGSRHGRGRAGLDGPRARADLHPCPVCRGGRRLRHRHHRDHVGPGRHDLGAHEPTRSCAASRRMAARHARDRRARDHSLLHRVGDDAATLRRGQTDRDGRGLWRLDRRRIPHAPNACACRETTRQSVFAFSPAADGGLWVEATGRCTLPRHDAPQPLPWTPPEGVRRDGRPGGDGHDWIGTYTGLHWRRAGQHRRRRTRWPASRMALRIATDHEGGVGRRLFAGCSTSRPIRRVSAPRRCRRTIPPPT